MLKSDSFQVLMYPMLVPYIVLFMFKMLSRINQNKNINQNALRVTIIIIYNFFRNHFPTQQTQHEKKQLIFHKDL